MEIRFFEEIESLTRDLVAVESIVKKGHESKAAEHIYDFYKNLDYFKKNEDHLILQKTVNDKVSRHNTICLLKGNGQSNKTVVLLGHIDTVGIEDFKYFKDSAFSPDDLLEILKKENLPDNIRRDLESGDYLFGRGALDMKSGVANHMALIKYYSENLDKLNGNIVAIAECDEEDSSMGIISALDVLKDLKEKYDLDYQVGINSDFTTPLYKDDPSRYIYLGTVGKLLPAFYVSGIETHVGQAFKGVDPSLVARKIDEKLNLNMEYADIGKGEATMPPVSLQMRDLKDKYDVQTPLASNLYYNFATHTKSPKDVMDLSKEIAEKSLEDAISYIEEQSKRWAEFGGYDYKDNNWKPRVFTFKELVDFFEETYQEEFRTYYEEYKERLSEEDPNLSIADYSLKLIDNLYRKFNTVNEPTVIVYYGSTYYQNVEISGEEEREVNLVKALEKTISDTKGLLEEEIKLKYFYPYISDSSFLYLPKDREGINSYKDNLPGWGLKYSHPIDKMESISMPVINLGVYGQDGHKYTERVHKNYSFQVLPNLIMTFIDNILK